MKDPAFLFYPGDFFMGTQFFSNEQVGIYIRLLIAQHQHGHLSKEQVIHICGTYDLEVMKKFAEDESGFFNIRLENEIQKRIKYSESRRNNKIGKQHMKNICESYDNHMENRNRNINTDINLLEESMRGDWESHRRQFLEDGSWQMSFCTKKNISKIHLDEKLKEFISDIDLKQDYKPKKELQSHFTNWFNKNKTIKHGKSTKSDGIYEAIENLRKSGGYYTGD